jgi:hypothetical protein
MKIFAFTFASLLPVAAIVPLAAQSADQLLGKNVSIAQTNYKGQSAIQVIAKPEAANATSYALIKDASFRDGVIEVDPSRPTCRRCACRRSWVYWHRFSDPRRRTLRVHLSQTDEWSSRRSSQAESLHPIQFVSRF